MISNPKNFVTPTTTPSATPRTDQRLSGLLELLLSPKTSSKLLMLCFLPSSREPLRLQKLSSFSPNTALRFLGVRLSHGFVTWRIWSPRRQPTGTDSTTRDKPRTEETSDTTIHSQWRKWSGRCIAFNSRDGFPPRTSTLEDSNLANWTCTPSEWYFYYAFW